MLYSIHQCITHIQRHELQNIVEQIPLERNRVLRVRYLMNDISEDDFKVALQQREKKYLKNVDFQNIYQMFVNVGSDIFRQIVVFINKKNNCEERSNFINENKSILDNLILYFNENLKKIGKMYKCVYPGITKEYVFARNIEL
jgi:hypothetical protein